MIDVAAIDEGDDARFRFSGSPFSTATPSRCNCARSAAFWSWVEAEKALTKNAPPRDPSIQRANLSTSP